MTSQVVNFGIVVITWGLTIYNTFVMLQGRPKIGKIGRALGAPGYIALLLAIIAMLAVDMANGGNGFLGRAAVTLLLIIAVDNFFNGDDPPKRRRRAWLKNKFAKLVLVRTS